MNELQIYMSEASYKGYLIHLIHKVAGVNRKLVDFTWFTCDAPNLSGEALAKPDSRPMTCKPS